MTRAKKEPATSRDAQSQIAQSQDIMSQDGKDATEIKALPFEQAMKELEDIVAKLEKGAVSLEESIAIYERGETLKKHCEALLKSAEERIEKITLGADGNPTGTRPLDIE